MSNRLPFLSNRLPDVDSPTDVISDVLQTARFTTLFFGRFDLGAPWAMRVPRKPTSSFYAVGGGGFRLKVEGVPEPLLLSTGDVVLLPHGAAHLLDDGTRRPAACDFISAERLRASALAPPGA